MESMKQRELFERTYESNRIWEERLAEEQRISRQRLENLLSRGYAFGEPHPEGNMATPQPLMGPSWVPGQMRGPSGAPLVTPHYVIPLCSVKLRGILLTSPQLQLVLCSAPSIPQPVFTITEKAPTRAFSWLKALTSAFTFKTILRHYAKLALTPRSLNVKLGPRRNYKTLC